MKNYVLLACAVWGLWACKADKQPATEEVSQFLIVPGEGFGTLKGELNRPDLEAQFESGQVVERPFYIGEGEFAPGLVVFPDTPKEVEILLDEENNAILYRLQQAGSPWATADGLRVGSTLEELVKINGKPIHFMGFDWDFGGIVTDWNGGTLDGKDFMVTLTYTMTETEDVDISKIVGDQVVSSSEPALAPHKVTVARIMQNN